MKSLIYTVLLTLVFSCSPTTKSDQITKNSSSISKFSIEQKLKNLNDPTNNQITVVAHRGDWRNAPENSLQAISNCIQMGVDMVEIDVQETKDGHLILMHDDTIGRTTTGRGRVKDWTLDSLMTLRLKDGLGIPTALTIPTLEEALNLSKNKILINLDKSYNIFDKCFLIAEKTGTTNQIIIKGAKTFEEVTMEFGQYLDKIKFMPVVGIDPKAIELVEKYLENDPPIAFEFIFSEELIPLKPYFKKIRDNGSSVWVNSLWPRLNGGHNDDKAVENNNEYQWYIDNHVNIIQTDRPALLLEYLRAKGLHD